MSQSFTALRQVSQLSHAPPLGGASSLIQTSKRFSPNNSCASISRLSSLRTTESTGLPFVPAGKPSLQRLEIIIRILRDAAIIELEDCTNLRSGLKQIILYGRTTRPGKRTEAPKSGFQLELQT